MVKKKTIEDAIELAQRRGGECLSTEYINCESCLIWKCQNSHIWKASYGNVNYGTWCPKCVGKMSAEDCVLLADQYKGKYLGEKNYNKRKIYKWECEAGHQWTGTFRKAKLRWCPYCNSNFQENINKNL